MKLNSCLRALLPFALLCGTAVAADVEISGLTHEWQSNQYSPLPKVKVVVTRNGSYVSSTTSANNPQDQAEYGIRVASGEPIYVVFYLSKDYVPEMQSLSARDGDQHRLSAALMTIAQYQQMRQKNPELPSAKQRLECISHFVPRESPIFNEIMSMRNQLE
jgi:hypothetical protein